MVAARSERHQFSIYLKASEMIKTQSKEQLDCDAVGNADFHFETTRIKSYRDWTISFMKPATLAAAGFYSTGKGDEVKCFECQIKICNWTSGANPMLDHQRWSKSCR